MEISKLFTEWLDTFAVHCNKVSDIVLHKTIYCINDRKNKYYTQVSVQLQVHKLYNQNIWDKNVMEFAMHCILNTLQYVSHIKTLQGLSSKFQKNSKTF